MFLWKASRKGSRLKRKTYPNANFGINKKRGSNGQEKYK
jgi:hypothetical protein